MNQHLAVWESPHKTARDVCLGKLPAVPLEHNNLGVRGRRRPYSVAGRTECGYGRPA